MSVNGISTAGMSRAEWLAERKKGIGGSDAAAILGLSPWATPVSVWLDKTGRAPEREETEAMRIGTELEDFVARRYTMETGREVRNHNFMLRDGYLLGDIDRLVIPEGAKVAAHQGEIRTDTLLECKTSSMEWPEGEVPLYYQIQVQHYMGLCPTIVHADVAALFLTRKHFEVFRVERDEEVIEEMKKRLTEWWAEYVIEDVAPPPATEEDCKLLWQRSNPGKKAFATAEICAKLKEYRDADAAAKRMKEEAEALKGDICAFMGDAETLATAEGLPLATWKSAKDASKTDWKAVATAMNAPAELVAANTTTTPGTRRFLVKGAA